jgi:hypothetical protein
MPEDAVEAVRRTLSRWTCLGLSSALPYL